MVTGELLLVNGMVLEKELLEFQVSQKSLILSTWCITVNVILVDTNEGNEDYLTLLKGIGVS